MDPISDKSLRTRGGKPVQEPHSFYWPGMVAFGTMRVCPSPIDAVFMILMFELKINRLIDLVTDLGIPEASVSRVRHRTIPMQHSWLLRAAILSNIPYPVLCEVAGEEPQCLPHRNAKKRENYE